MRTDKEIVKKIKVLKDEIQPAEDSYFSSIESKQKGEIVSDIDFIRIESEYDIIKKEIDTLLWVLKIKE